MKNTTKKNKGGRPTSYNVDVIKKSKEYLEHYESIYGDAIPSIAGLSIVLGVARQTIYDWIGQGDKKKFSDILENILSTQEKTLINKGLKNEFNANIVKLALGKHGYKEKSDITTNDKPIQQVTGMVIIKDNEDTIQDSK